MYTESGSLGVPIDCQCGCGNYDAAVFTQPLPQSVSKRRFPASHSYWTVDTTLIADSTPDSPLAICIPFFWPFGHRATAFGCCRSVSSIGSEAGNRAIRCEQEGISEIVRYRHTDLSKPTDWRVNSRLASGVKGGKPIIFGTTAAAYSRFS